MWCSTRRLRASFSRSFMRSSMKDAPCLLENTDFAVRSITSLAYSGVSFGEKGRS